MQRDTRSGRDGLAIHTARPPLLRIARQSHLRSRPEDHVPILQRRVQPPGNYKEYKYGVPPPDRRTIRKDKSDPGSLPENLLQSPTGRLGALSANGTIRDQLEAFHDHQAFPIRSPHGFHSQGTSSFSPIKSWKGHEPSRSHQSASSGGGAEHQTRTRIGDQTKQVQTVLRRTESLVRLYAPQNNAPCDQTTPKTIWTLHGDQENFPCRLPGGPAAQLEDSQCLPCVTPIPISRNAGTWPELHGTPT